MDLVQFLLTESEPGFFCINVHNVSMTEYGSKKIALAVFYYNVFEVLEVHVCENSNVIFHHIPLNVTSTNIKMHVTGL